MSITRIQASINNGSGTSITITPSSAPTVGNCQVISISYNSATASKVSSITQTNCTWTRATQSNNISGLSCDVWYSLNAGSSPGTSITVTLGSSLTYSWSYLEYSGVATTSALDQTASSQDSNISGSTQTGTTSTTASTNEVCVGSIAVDQDKSYQSPTNSFTIVQDSAIATDLVILERIVSSTGTYGTVVSFAGGTPFTWNSAGVIITLSAPSTINAGFLSFC